MRGEDHALLERRRAKRDDVERPLHSPPSAPPRRFGRGEHSFSLFQKFPELRVGVFGKSSGCTSDQECAEQLGFKNFALLNQVHGNVTHIIGRGDSRGACPEPSRRAPTVLNGDGLITTTPHLALSIRFADCQAFAIYAPKKKVLGVLHAGWKGMAAGAITAHFEQLKVHFGIEPSETFVGAAPSLCKHCAEFSDPKKELPAHLHPFIEDRCIDLIAAAEAEFDALGIPKAQRERFPDCTKCGEGFWSYRRDKKEARNYLVAGITSAVGVARHGG